MSLATSPSSQTAFPAAAAITAVPSATRRRLAVVRMAREAIAAGQAPGLAKAANSDAEFSARSIYNLAIQGDPDARRIFHRFGQVLGILLAGLINVLNMDMFVIGGGVASAWDAFAPQMFAELRERSLVYAATAPEDPLGKDKRKARPPRSRVIRARRRSSPAPCSAATPACTAPPESPRHTCHPEARFSRRRIYATCCRSRRLRRKGSAFPFVSWRYCFFVVAFGWRSFRLTQLLGRAPFGWRSAFSAAIKMPSRRRALAPEVDLHCPAYLPRRTQKNLILLRCPNAHSNTIRRTPSTQRSYADSFNAQPLREPGCISAHVAIKKIGRRRNQAIS